MSPETTTRPMILRQPATTRMYDIVLELFCSLLLVSNIGATKLIAFGPDLTVLGFPLLPIVTDGGAFLFPLTYILGDLLAEVYGMRLARRAILLGFAIALLASLTFLVIDTAPAAAGFDQSVAWHAVLGFVPRIVAASLCGFLAGQFLNAYVVVRLRDRARPGSRWWRLVSSTLVGELADTTIFCTIAFGGLIGVGTLVNYILVGYVWKVGVEVVMLPVTLRVIPVVRRYEGYPVPGAAAAVEPAPEPA
ncbi:MAG TPA: queuosine precursor transporter [Propionibacteriaceae bacterium]|nr:queuosine precursor transporter [Propionibacteriaceae bacterium]